MGLAVTSIRRMTGEDVEAVAAMEAAHQPRPWSEKVFRDEIATDNRVYLVALDDDLVVGYGGVMMVGDEGHVTNLLVDPERRRGGIGRSLMLGLMAAAVEAGARHLTLEVRKANHPARSLYAGLGMAPVGVRPDYYGDDDALVMWAHDIDRPLFLEGLR